MATVGQEEVGRGGVYLPPLIRPGDPLVCGAEGDLVGALGLVRVDDPGPFLGVGCLPCFHPAGNALDGDGRAALAGGHHVFVGLFRLHVGLPDHDCQDGDHVGLHRTAVFVLAGHVGLYLGHSLAVAVTVHEPHSAELLLVSQPAGQGSVAEVWNLGPYRVADLDAAHGVFVGEDLESRSLGKAGHGKKRLERANDGELGLRALPLPLGQTVEGGEALDAGREAAGLEVGFFILPP